MRTDTQDAFVGAAVIVVLALILIVGLRHFDQDIPHQDVNCFTESGDELQAKAEARLKALGLADEGDTVLILSGQSDLAAATNMLRVHEVS